MDDVVVSRETISNITGGVLDGLAEWRVADRETAFCAVCFWTPSHVKIATRRSPAAVCVGVGADRQLALRYLHLVILSLDSTGLRGQQ